MNIMDPHISVAAGDYAFAYDLIKTCFKNHSKRLLLHRHNKDDYITIDASGLCLLTILPLFNTPRMVTDNQACFKMYLDALATDPSILKTEDSSIGIAGRINKLQVELKG